MTLPIFFLANTFFFTLVFPLSFGDLSSALGNDLPEGVRPLLTTEGRPLKTFVPEEAIFLNDAKTLDGFLKKVEGQPPDWKFLFGSDVEERYDRLFDEMEKRDSARAGNPTLNQSVAFLWDGDLTSFRPQHNGFGVAIGPRQLPSPWGIVRFKIANQPSEMVAIPSSNLLPTLEKKRSAGEPVEITILFIGKLLPEESFMYDFSTVEEGEGMILPVVNVKQIYYYLE